MHRTTPEPTTPELAPAGASERSIYTRHDAVAFRIDAIQLLEYGGFGQRGYTAITGDLGRRLLPCTCRFALAVDFTAANNNSVMLSAEVVGGASQSVFFQQFTVRAARNGADRAELLLTPIALSASGPYVFIVWLGQSPIFILTTSVAELSTAPNRHSLVSRLQQGRSGFMHPTAGPPASRGTPERSPQLPAIKLDAPAAAD